MVRDGALADHATIDPRDSWLMAAAECDLPLFVPGWEDPTLGNMFVSSSFDGRLRGLGAVPHAVRVSLTAIRERERLEEGLKVLAGLLAESPAPCVFVP